MEKQAIVDASEALLRKVHTIPYSEEWAAFLTAVRNEFQRQINSDAKRTQHVETKANDKTKA